jgi:formimidoylglutamate deiminase
MKTYLFKGLLLNEGWLANAHVSVDESGRISAISTDKVVESEQINAFAIPAFQNAHSHGFQYAMAGLAEKHAISETADDFWTWRDAMYKLALKISPDEMQAIAEQLYSEMLRHGYSNVAEFHYLHHDLDGNPYSNLSEMGERLIAAASAVGIGITLVPIFYQKGGFGKAPSSKQKRFISPTIDNYYQLLEASEKSCAYYEHANIAVGIHSMRGVEPHDIVEVAARGRQDIPFHIHIAEQLKEIDDALAYWGKRPVEWMLDNIELSDRFHLVHATHLTDKETELLGKSGANVVLCPSTEGNLGDGIFPLRNFQNNGGEWSIGTDSHIGINPFEELRLLDYGQRLISHERNIFNSQEQGDSGSFAIDMSLRTGRKAMGNFSEHFFKVGDYFDACLLDANSPVLASTSNENLCSSIVYSTDSSMHYGTFSKGKMMVEKGKHKKSEVIDKKYKEIILRLGNR